MDVDEGIAHAEYELWRKGRNSVQTFGDLLYSSPGSWLHASSQMVAYTYTWCSASYTALLHSSTRNV